MPEDVRLGSSPMIHIFRNTDDNDYEVWLNLATDFDGFCVGAHSNHQLAIKDAITTLESVQTTLKEHMNVSK